MRNYLKVSTNIVITSIGLSVLLGSFLRIFGPIYQNNKINRDIKIVGRNGSSIEQKSLNRNSNLLLLYENKLDKFKRLEKLIRKWESLIIKNPDLEVSCFFFSLDNKVYAEINSNSKIPSASSIKVPILIVLLTMVDEEEIFWNEELTLTKEAIGSGSGWIRYQKIGEKFPVFELASEMIKVSDDTATNLLIKRIGGINIVNQKFKEIGLTNTQINTFFPDLNGTNLTSTKDLSLAMALVDNGYLLKISSRDIFRDIMQKSKRNSLIPAGILRGLGKKAKETDYHLSVKGYLVQNKAGDMGGIYYSDTALIQTPHKSKVFVSFIVKGPFNEPRSAELIRNLSAELVPFLVQDHKPSNSN